MQIINYDPTFEEFPLEWAKTCPTGHSTIDYRKKSGENIFYSMSVKKPVLVEYDFTSAV